MALSNVSIVDIEHVFVSELFRFQSVNGNILTRDEIPFT